MILTADIGATKTVLAQASAAPGGVTLAAVRRFENREYSSFDSILKAYLADVAAPAVSALGVAVAGPVAGDRCRLTNLSWDIDGAALARQFAFTRVILLNDLAAAGYGLEVISNDALMTINRGEGDRQGNSVLLSPGTGLGESIIHVAGGRRIPIATEGGHADFAPFDGVTARLWKFLKKDFSRVSVEDLLSGPGIHNIFRFLLSESGIEPDDQLARDLATDPGARITNRALEGRDSTAVWTIRLFWDILAAESGNMALKAMATGGVYLGGGIIPRILPLLDAPRFVSVFSDKGRHQILLQAMPVHAVTDTALPLHGMAQYLVDS